MIEAQFKTRCKLSFFFGAMMTNHNASRLTAYVLISALEADLRAACSEYLQDAASPRELLGEAAFAEFELRLAADYGEDIKPGLRDLIEYSDFGFVVDFLGQHRLKLPAEIAKLLIFS